MFEEDCCLQCGNPVQSLGRIYCSDECENLDTTSPSISTVSSAFSSPQLQGYDMPGAHDVPALVPSALGTALSLHSTKKPRANRYSLSSSKSSLMWYEDDDSDNPIIAVEDDNDGDLDSRGLRPGPIMPFAVHPSGLSYARRPSTTNTHSTIPLLHRRTSSGTPSLSAAYSLNSTQSSTEDDSDAPVPVSPRSPPVDSIRTRRRHVSISEDNDDNVHDTVTVRHKRNRASLPAYFSLLQLGSAPSRASLSIHPPSSYTPTRPSPTTPRLARPALDSTYAIAVSSPAGGMHYPGSHTSSLLASAHTRDDRHIRDDFGTGMTPPRGRPREPGSSRRRTCSRSPSPSPSRARRTLSPPMLIKDGSAPDVRGRRRTHELDGWGDDRVYGYGNGRSGLRERERGRRQER
ncbi:hypothetical protein EW146_g5456 [Bondarzewia mesenterica]|uniref:Uncharacterized protein n=1 Tax=Bondarzewia mesenterica TaxID=1095465 RepID=A0A4V3XEU2_9AGAM|nr:hypothetical protein EW146_g5456 [Bondarzewia mesenterica]